MLTEQDKLTQEKDTLLDHLKFNAEIIVAAAKYQRLLGNKDFLEIVKEMEEVKKVLDNEVLVLSHQLATEYDAAKRAEIQNEILIKSIRRLVIIEGAGYPQRIANEAAQAAEESVEIRKQLKEKHNADA